MVIKKSNVYKLKSKSEVSCFNSPAVTLMTVSRASMGIDKERKTISLNIDAK